MKKVVALFLVLSLFSLSGILAEGCNLEVSLLNQDPYPAIQGDSAKIIFQIEGIENVECGTVKFELIDEYPITILPGQDKVYTIEAGTFKKDYKSFFLAPYEVRISEEALDGDNPIEVQYKHGANVGFETKQFNLNIEDTRADFEVHVKNYDPVEKIITFEILNIAEANVEALTIEIPRQENIEIKGANINIVGDLDSNEYTTADFEASPEKGEIQLKISYSDAINERRTLTKKVLYEPDYFEGRDKYQKKSPVKTYIIIFIIIALVGYWHYQRYKKKKLAQMKRARH